MANELNQLYAFLSKLKSQSSITGHLSNLQVTCSLERSSHFGGLWEAAVKSMKFHLRRVVGPQKLTFEEMMTVLSQIEACLNSRPLTCATSHSEDGVDVLTPGHYLIGRPLCSLPSHDFQMRIWLFSKGGLFVNHWLNTGGRDGPVNIFNNCSDCTNGKVLPEISNPMT